MSDFRNISIIGIGLIGGSLGLALKEADSSLRIHGFDIKPGTAAQAQQRGIIDIAYDNLEEAVKEADVVFVATPVGEIVKVIRKVLPWLRAGTVITDVGSTKEKIVRTVEKALPEGVHFIGGHPMTGSEQEGFVHANKNLFKDSYYILTPTPKTDGHDRLYSGKSLQGKLGDLGIISNGPDYGPEFAHRNMSPGSYLLQFLHHVADLFFGNAFLHSDYHDQLPS
ncbi:prephenate dehydrogenase, partial [Candidatus Hakubella thermalkaliphila]